MKTAVSPQPVMLMTFVTVLILMAGSSRFDLPSLILIRPLSMLFLVVAIMQLSPDGWRENRFIIVMMAAIILLPTLQLVPLPPRLWHSLAGRDLVQQIDIAAGIIGAWRPLTLSPLGTENALFSLAVPAAVLFAGFGLDRRQRNALLPFVLSLILASALLGLLQILGPHGGPLYFYRVTHADSAVGFLANRNHHATLVAAAFPILAVLASDPEYRQRIYGRPLIALLVGIVLVPMILIIGSRMGLIVTALSLALSALLYLAGVQGQGAIISRKGGIISGLVLATTVAIVVVTLVVGRAEALQRVVAWSAENDERIRVWTTVTHFTQGYWPWGTGFGSFVEMYKIYEPRAMLDPAYFNQAHNDWIEVLMTGGLAAAILLAVSVGAWCRRAWQLCGSSSVSVRDDQIARLGLVIVLLFAVGSITDYPLRVPSMSAVFVIAVLWTLPARALKRRASAVIKP